MLLGLGLLNLLELGCPFKAPYDGHSNDLTMPIVGTL